MTREPRWGHKHYINYTTEMTCEPGAFLGCEFQPYMPMLKARDDMFSSIS